MANTDKLTDIDIPNTWDLQHLAATAITSNSSVPVASISSDLQALLSKESVPPPKV